MSGIFKVHCVIVYELETRTPGKYDIGQCDQSENKLVVVLQVDLNFPVFAWRRREDFVQYHQGRYSRTASQLQKLS